MSAADSEAERIVGCIGGAYIEALKSGASYRQAARAALAALRQHRPDVAAVLDGWQPIETAPHDGTRVLLVDMTDGHLASRVGFYRRSIQWFASTDGSIFPNTIKWHPLPAPPRTEGAR